MKDIKAALVTGGATGIGKACALSFLEGGYAVAIVGRRKEKIEETEKELADIFGNEKVLAIAAVRMWKRSLLLSMKSTVG